MACTHRHRGFLANVNKLWISMHDFVLIQVLIEEHHVVFARLLTTIVRHAVVRRIARDSIILDLFRSCLR